MILNRMEEIYNFIDSNINEMNIIMIGYGAVQKTVDILWDKITNRKISCLYIIEPLDLSVEPKHKYIHIQVALTRNNYKSVFKEIKNVDLVIDLSVWTSGVSISGYFQKQGIHYINTSIEDWKTRPMWNGSFKTMKKYTLQTSQDKIKKGDLGTSHMIDCGMNPGIVSVFIKLALEKLAKKYNINSKNYSKIAQELNLEVVHISEVDTQIVKSKKKRNEFLNTWSCVGFSTEAIDPTQLGFGEFEKEIDKQHIKQGRQVILPIRSMNVKCKSFEPKTGEFIGRCICHSENNTITNFLSSGKYNPSVYYVYKSCPAAEESLKQLRKRKYKLQRHTKVLSSKDILSGFDSVGVLLLFKDKPSFFCGSIVDNKDALKISEEINATTMQVAAGLFSGIEYILNNPKEGVIWPEKIPIHYLEKVKSLLGFIYCDFVNHKFKNNQFNKLKIKTND